MATWNTQFINQYGDTADNEGLVKAAYEDLLGYDDADTMANADARIDYWVDLLEQGDVSPEGLGATMIEQSAQGGAWVNDEDLAGNSDVRELLLDSEEFTLDECIHLASVVRNGKDPDDLDNSGSSNDSDGPDGADDSNGSDDSDSTNDSEGSDRSDDSDSSDDPDSSDDADDSNGSEDSDGSDGSGDLEIPPEITGPQPTVLETMLIELTNRARIDPEGEAHNHIDMSNAICPPGFDPDDITAAPAAPLAFNQDLQEAAQIHGDWMQESDDPASWYISTWDDGTDVGDRVDMAGYDALHHGQNQIAAWTNEPYEDAAESMSSRDIDLLSITAERHHIRAFTDDNTRSEMLNEDYEEIGSHQAGYDFTHPNGSEIGNAIQTQKFGSREDSGSFITGVIHDGSGPWNSGDDDFYAPKNGLSGVMIEHDGEVTRAFDTGLYSIEVDEPGEHELRFFGGDLAEEITTTVNVGDDNAKLDIVGGSAQTVYDADGLVG